MIGFGVVATFFALGDARSRAQDDDERAAALAAANVGGALEATVAAVHGADVLVADGVVESDEFDALRRRGDSRHAVPSAGVRRRWWRSPTVKPS